MQIGGATIGIRIISIVSGIVLARLLDPRDFGLVALVQVVLSTAGYFSGLGLAAAVIQSQTDRGKVAFQAFVVTAVAGTVLFLVLVINAGFFAALLGNTEIISIFRWLSITVLLGTLMGVPEALLQKELLFGRASAIVIICELLHTALAVGMALGGLGVWSLVYASVARSFVNLALIWMMCPGWDWLIPKPWDRQIMTTLMRFGLQITGSGVMSFFYSIIDSYSVGRFLGAAPLGFYSKAYEFTIRTVYGFSSVISVVLLPSYARIQNEKERLSRAYLKSLRVVSFLTVPMSMGIFITAPEMVSTLLGEKWLPMIAPLEVMAFVGLIMPISASTAALFSSTGRPDYNMRAGAVVTVVLIPMIFLLLGSGITGVAFAVLIAHVLGFAFNIYQVHTILEHTASKMLPAVFPALIGTAVMMMCVQFSKPVLLFFGGGAITIASLIVMVFVGIIIYSSVLYVIQRSLVIELVGLAIGRPGSEER